MKTRLFIIFIFLLLSVQQVSSAEKDYTDFVKYLQEKINEKPFKG
jgi:hypothetical protein